MHVPFCVDLQPPVLDFPLGLPDSRDLSLHRRRHPEISRLPSFPILTTRALQLACCLYMCCWPCSGEMVIAYEGNARGAFAVETNAESTFINMRIVRNLLSSC